MPVYYEEKDERRAYIKEEINKSCVAIDTSCFAGYLYKDLGYSDQNLEYKEYDELLDTIKHRFPRTEVFTLVKDTFAVIDNLEEEYIQAWTGKLNEGTGKNNDHNDYSFMDEYNSYWGDC